MRLLVDRLEPPLTRVLRKEDGRLLLRVSYPLVRLSGPLRLVRIRFPLAFDAHIEMLLSRGCHDHFHRAHMRCDIGPYFRVPAVRIDLLERCSDRNGVSDGRHGVPQTIVIGWYQRPPEFRCIRRADWLRDR